MPIYDVNQYFSNIGTRNEVRTRVINIFLDEIAGNGTGTSASKYNYNVATLINGNNVILTRPANLKNGFDFLIRISNINFNLNGRSRDYPKHDEIINDLEIKKNNNSILYNQLRIYINDIFNCNIEVENINFNSLNFNIGYDVDMLLHIIKWFFIEQDIRYWNYSGRNMLMSSIP
jgi:hypothetical protein